MSERTIVQGRRAGLDETMERLPMLEGGEEA
jgi:hypothetical protein